MRGVGWNWGKEHVSSWPRGNPEKKCEWLRLNAWRLVKLYAVMDVLHTINQQRASFHPPGSIRGQNPLLIGIDTIIAGLSGICGIRASYDLLVFTLVFLNISEPRYNPPLFGSSSQLYSISVFWSRFWHQLFRDSFLHLGSGNKLIFAFALSALLHSLPNFVFLRRVPVGSIAFFMLQPAGIWIEKKLGLRGTWWTVLWFATVGGWLMDEYVQAGFWSIPLVPFSFCTLLVESLWALS